MGSAMRRRNTSSIGSLRDFGQHQSEDVHGGIPIGILRSRGNKQRRGGWIEWCLAGAVRIVTPRFVSDCSIARGHGREMTKCHTGIRFVQLRKESGSKTIQGAFAVFDQQSQHGACKRLRARPHAVHSIDPISLPDQIAVADQDNFSDSVGTGMRFQVIHRGFQLFRIHGLALGGRGLPIELRENIWRGRGKLLEYRQRSKQRHRNPNSAIETHSMTSPSLFCQTVRFMTCPCQPADFDEVTGQPLPGHP